MWAAVLLDGIISQLCLRVYQLEGQTNLLKIVKKTEITLYCRSIFSNKLSLNSHIGSNDKVMHLSVLLNIQVIHIKAHGKCNHVRFKQIKDNRTHYIKKMESHVIFN